MSAGTAGTVIGVVVVWAGFLKSLYDTWSSVYILASNVMSIFHYQVSVCAANVTTNNKT